VILILIGLFGLFLAISYTSFIISSLLILWIFSWLESFFNVFIRSNSSLYFCKFIKVICLCLHTSAICLLNVPLVLKSLKQYKQILLLELIQWFLSYMS